MEKKNLSKKKYNIIDVYNSPTGSEYYFYDNNVNSYVKIIVSKDSDGCKYILNADGSAVSLKNSSEEINKIFYKEIKEYTFSELSDILEENQYKKVKVAHEIIDIYLPYDDVYRNYNKLKDVVNDLMSDLSASKFVTVVSEGKWYIEEED